MLNERLVTHGYVLSPTEYQWLKLQQDVRGIPIDLAIGDALQDYIECGLKTRLETVQNMKLNLA